MPTDLFERVLVLLEATSAKYSARVLLERSCRLIGRTPYNLRDRDIGVLMIGLLSTVSDILPRKEWKELEDGMERLALEIEGPPLGGKVRGLVLDAVMLLIRERWGLKVMRSIKRNGSLPFRFKHESWYPIDVLVSILCSLNGRYDCLTKKAFRGLGADLIVHNGNLASSISTSESNPSLAASLRGLRTLFYLKGFGVHSNNGGIALEFNEMSDPFFCQFIEGMCDGIAQLGNEPVAVEQMDLGEESTSRILLRPTGGESE